MILTRIFFSAWKLTRIILCPLSLDPKKRSSPIYLGPKNLDTILMYWMSVKLADNFQIREHSWPCLFHIINVLVNLSIPVILMVIFFFSQSECKLVHKAQKFHFCHNLEFRRDFFLIVDLRVLKLISSRLSFLLFYCFVSSISWKLVKEAKQNNMRAMRAKSQ